MTPNEYKELVDFLGRKFERIDGRFDQVDQRFAQVDQRFDQVDQRFDQVDQRFDQVDQRFGKVEGEIRGVRVLVEKNASDIRTVAEGVKVANERLDRFQAEVRQEFADVRQEMKWGFDGIHDRVDRVEDAMTQDRAGRRT